MELIADFRADWVELMRARLKEKGFKVKASATDAQVSRTYWNVVWRHVPVQPRKVFKAKELVCPSQHQAGLAALGERFEKGEDVNPWLSSTRTNGNFHDKLLNDWGIQHFHLGLTPRERFNHCVFARVLADAVFFVHVLPHNRYTERDLVRRIHANWPSILENYRAKGFTVPDDLDDEQVQTLRNKNTVFVLKMDDGTAYFPPGGGLMTSGLAFGVQRNSDLAMGTANFYQTWLAENLPRLAADFERGGRPIQPPAIFKLLVQDGHIAWALEVNSRAQFKLGPLLRPSTTPPVKFR